VETNRISRFLLGRLHLAALFNKDNRQAVLGALSNLPQSLVASYDEAWERIGKHPNSERAKQVLSWISFASRPLTIRELQHALAISSEDTNLKQSKLPVESSLTSACMGLVTVDQQSQVVRLAHETTEAYFKEKRQIYFPNAQQMIVVTCLTYLSFDTFATGFCPTDEEFEARLQLNPLYDYAARNWGHHARAGSKEVVQVILGLLESEARVAGSSQAMMASRSFSGYSQRVPRQMTGVHVAAYFGLKEAIAALLTKDGVDPDSKNSYGRTPLSWAAENGHEAVVQLLLAKDGVDPDSKDTYYGQTPLSRAAENGHEAVVQLLLAKDGVDLDSKDTYYGRTPLSWAAGNGHEAVVQLLKSKT
jgi:Ankyrin repeats (3 copies)